MLRISLLCNAGIALDDGTDVLLIDLPNEPSPPFHCLPERAWKKIMDREPPYDRVKGFFFTHSHRDHFASSAVEAYISKWPDTQIWFPKDGVSEGALAYGGIRVQYSAFPHAPLPEGVPPHVVAWISAGGKELYLSADAKLDVCLHKMVLGNRKADCAIWNPKYLSYNETRKLMEQSASLNLIYHMPAERPDETGIWKKAERNFERYADELKNVHVLGTYPITIKLK